jgi:L,D-peptidoglycan transpeptidase YkuD (ErfK/YbiS/YcfS/YnhG family)
MGEKIMKLYKNIWKPVVLSFIFAAVSPATAFARGEATGPAQEIALAEQAAVYSGDVNTLQAAEDATQLIVVVGNTLDPAKGNLSWYQRDESGRLVPVLSVEAVSGMFGITAKKTEGDKKTPCGVYHFSSAFGLKENPGTILPYHQIVEGDYYVDDSNSRYYNRLANTNLVEKDWNSAEDLMRQAPQYNYGLVLDYNPDCVPGKGSAIFLHCPKSSNNTGTSGCISIPEEYMKQVVCQVDAGTKIIVVQQESDLAAY